MIDRFPKLGLLAATLIIAGCANPADDVEKAKVAPPVVLKPADSADKSPAPAATADATKPAPTAPSSTAAGSMVFSGETSKIDFVGSKVTGSHNGGFKTFTGTMKVEGDKHDVSQLTADIDMTSTWADNPMLAGHLKSKDFFDVEKYPKATFISTDIKSGGEKGATHTITGNFELHGVTKSISFPATIKSSDTEATLDSQFVINRKDFEIAFQGKPDDLIRNEVVIKLALKAAPASSPKAAN